MVKKAAKAPKKKSASPKKQPVAAKKQPAASKPAAPKKKSAIKEKPVRFTLDSFFSDPLKQAAKASAKKKMK